MKATKDTIRVKLDIRPEPVSPAQKTAWRIFWQRLLSEVNDGGTCGKQYKRRNHAARHHANPGKRNYGAE
jgi:hypothetical protein